MDYTRRYDLEILADGINKARTQKERERFQKMAYKMINVSAPIRSLREELVGAIRVGDARAVRRISQHINNVKQRETNYKSWGNVRGEEIDKHDR